MVDFWGEIVEEDESAKFEVLPHTTRFVKKNEDSSIFPV